MNKLIIQALKFGAVGLINTIIGLLAIYALMFFLNAGPVTANAFGYIVGLLVSYLLNRGWTFSKNKSAPNSIVRFIAVAVFAYVLNLAVVLFVIDLPGANPYVAQCVGIFFYTITMFVGCRIFVFRLAAKNNNGGSRQ
ncbi:GtrA family protein [Pseudomonas fluorescens]|uniref:GtrA family protein n=1 Tax=Pseudomonas fluorescens TaxID=294 RepID=UPI0006984051|nr:GtrA family protein [Pseudomonas fluorescens]